MALTTNLISYWKLDESSAGSSPVTRNDSKSTNNLTDNNNVASTTGIISNAAAFVAASSKSLTISDAAQAGLDITGDFAFSLWFNQANTTITNKLLLGKWTSATNDRSFAFFISTGNLLRTYISSDGTNANTTKIFGSHTAFAASTWYHLALNYNAAAGTMDFWINGAAQTQITGHKTSVFSGAGPFGIGDVLNDFGYFDGSIDEVGIWNRTLTSDEVTQLYNAGAGFTYPFGATAPPPASNFLLMGVG